MECVVDLIPPYQLGCSSIIFSTLGIKYYKVCGHVRGYRCGTTNPCSSGGIDSYYYDGISITYGQNLRRHIWTYFVGLPKDIFDLYACPCRTGYSGGRKVTSSFIGNHYYCECDLNPGKSCTNEIQWKCKNCDIHKTSCCTNCKAPLFYRILDDMTQDDIELRVCDNKDGNILLYFIELFVR